MTDITEAIDVLQAGGIIAYPTETYYGLGASIARPDAVQRLWDLKERALGGTLSLLVGSPASLAELTAAGATESALFVRLAERFWPGPLTLVLDARPDLDPRLVGPDGGVAVRLSSHPLADRLVRRLGHPLTATSANRRGQPPPRIPAEIHASGLADDLDYVLEGGPTPGGLPSTLVRLHGDQLRLLRPGAIADEALRDALTGLPFSWLG